MSPKRSIESLRAEVAAREAEYGAAMGFLRADSDRLGTGPKERWFATLAKFPRISDRLVRAYREYTEALERRSAAGS